MIQELKAKVTQVVPLRAKRPVSRNSTSLAPPPASSHVDETSPSVHTLERLPFDEFVTTNLTESALYPTTSNTGTFSRTEASPPKTRQGFWIAILCALPKEASTVETLLDIRWDDKGHHYGEANGDKNVSSTGWICGHNVVLVHLGRMGKAEAASVSASLKPSFANIELALLFGICGGVPISENNRVLGDVIISTGLVQYDLGQFTPSDFMQNTRAKDILGPPSENFERILNKLQTPDGKRRLLD